MVQMGDALVEHLDSILSPEPPTLEQVETEWMVVFAQAALERINKERSVDRARTALRSLMTCLQLGQDDMARLFAVSRETIRRWEQGKTAIPIEKETKILEVEVGLSRLQEIFRPDRLAAAVRRQADLFDGETALEWILRGRIREVADRYETAFLYQA